MIADLTTLPPDHRLPDLLIRLGLEHQLTWQQAEEILSLWEHRAQGPVLRAEASAQDLALALYMVGAPPTSWPQFWDGASPDAAFLLDLSPENPGDNSGLHLRTPAQLLADLIALRLLPRSPWKRRRVEATLAERRLRDPRGQG